MGAAWSIAAGAPEKKSNAILGGKKTERNTKCSLIRVDSKLGHTITKHWL